MKNKFTVKNSLELANKLKEIKITNETKMGPFDLKNLYTNIPIKETLEIIKTHLIEKKLEMEYTTQLIKIIETIMNQNYFQFNNKLHEQKEGIPMESCQKFSYKTWRMNISTTSQENIK